MSRAARAFGSDSARAPISAASSVAGDTIMIKDLLVRNIIGVDSWERLKKQDIIINIRLQTDLTRAGSSDELEETINYSTVCKDVVDVAESKPYKSVEGLAEAIAQRCVSRFPIELITVRVAKPRALLYAASAGLMITRARPSPTLAAIDSIPVAHKEDQIFIEDLLVRTIIGVNAWEREERQDVLINLIIWSNARAVHEAGSRDFVHPTYNYRTICHTVHDAIQESSFLTIEAMASTISEILITQCHVGKVTVRIDKPSALLMARAASVEITRDDKHFANGRQHLIPIASATTSAGRTHRAVLGLGSNLGDRAGNIARALRELEALDCVVLNTAFLYETAPMLVEEQPMFLNTACIIQTDLGPRALLAAVKQVEARLGRDLSTSAQRYGPRPIDLDILFYDNIEYADDQLTIPHPHLHEREFVLKPLVDIAGGHEHPKMLKTVAHLYSHLSERSQIAQVAYVGGSLWRLGERTVIMGVLNVTPDSFSDGGKYVTLEAAVTHAKAMLEDGATIIDIGGQSTRPNAEEVSVQEELERVVPVIRALREAGITAAISVDTYRAEVARAAVEAGVSMINDVSGGARDPAMYAEMARAGVPVVLMHMRGDSHTMMSLKTYEEGIVAGVRHELEDRVAAALAAGVRRWNIFVDPGLGFAKRPESSLHLLQHIDALVAKGTPLAGFPTLAGPSRKGFLGSVVSKDAEHKPWATAAACSALVASGTDVIRVHDVKEMVDVVKVSDAIWRRSGTRPT